MDKETTIFPASQTPNVEPVATPVESRPDPKLEDEAEGQYDQTLFAEDILFLDSDAKPIVVQPSAGKRKISKRIILLGALGVVAIVLMVASVLLTAQRQKIQRQISQSDLQNVQTSSIPPELQRQLTLLDNNIQTADPLSSPLSFPPINFKLDLQDATVKKLKLQP